MVNQRVGSRRQVWNGTAKETSGGLKRSDLFKDKYGNLKSRKASKKAKRSKNLKKAGYTAVKGKFGAVRISGKPVKSKPSKKSSKRKSSKKSKKRSNKSRKKKGGHAHSHPRRKQKGGHGPSGAPPTLQWQDGRVGPLPTASTEPGATYDFGTDTALGVDANSLPTYRLESGGLGTSGAPAADPAAGEPGGPVATPGGNLSGADTLQADGTPDLASRTGPFADYVDMTNAADTNARVRWNIGTTDVPLGAAAHAVEAEPHPPAR